jgi:CheY-like chemotaxis protein
VKRKSVLVVEPDHDRLFDIGGWLEDAGYEVLLCPGPRAPSYECVAAHNGDCPLAKAADVVMLDMHLASDDAMQGIPGWELLLYYLDRGAKVVALSGDPDSFRPRPDHEVAVVRRPPDRRELIGAVTRLLSVRAHGAGDGHDLAR